MANTSFENDWALMGNYPKNGPTFTGELERSVAKFIQ